MIGPVELPFNGCPPDACDSLSTGSCPTEVGDTLVYELDFEVHYSMISLISSVVFPHLLPSVSMSASRKIHLETFSVYNVFLK